MNPSSGVPDRWPLLFLQVVRMVTCRDRRLCEYPSQVVRLRQLVSGPQELELLYPYGDWFSALVVTDVAVHEDSVPQQSPDGVERVGVAYAARLAPPELIAEGERVLPMYCDRLQTPFDCPRSASRNVNDFINVCRHSTSGRCPLHRFILDRAVTTIAVTSPATYLHRCV